MSRGIFQRYTKIYNRAPVDLFVMFDGQRDRIPSGPYELPNVTVIYAKNQNPIMGSVDPNNPHVSGGRYLIVEEGEEGFGEQLSKDEWEAHLGRPCRFDEVAVFEEKYATDPGAKMVTLGKGRKSTATSRYEAGGAPGGNAAFSGKD